MSLNRDHAAGQNGAPARQNWLPPEHLPGRVDVQPPHQRPHPGPVSHQRPTSHYRRHGHAMPGRRQPRRVSGGRRVGKGMGGGSRMSTLDRWWTAARRPQASGATATTAIQFAVRRRMQRDEVDASRTDVRCRTPALDSEMRASRRLGSLSGSVIHGCQRLGKGGGRPWIPIGERVSVRWTGTVGGLA